MTIALITDTHIGARSGSNIFREYMRFWYDEQFFPELVKRGVKTIVHGGDFFDSRNAIGLQDIDFVVNWFAKRLIDCDMVMVVILGNHDVAFKNTNRIHSLSILKAAAPNNVEIIEECEHMVIDNQKYLMVPWINSSNYDSTLEMLSSTNHKEDTIVIGHFEIQGAKHYKNSPPAEHGLDAELFNQFKEVWSGHFHHKSKMGNIKYLGSAFHLNWQDYDDARGFHFFEDGELEFVENEYCLFIEKAFDKDHFAKMTDAEYLVEFEGMFVRLVIDSEYDRVALMDTIAKINRAKPHDLTVINNHVLTEGKQAQNQADVEARTTKSTEEYITDYIEAHEEYNTVVVKTIMLDLIQKAQDKMVVGE